MTDLTENAQSLYAFGELDDGTTWEGLRVPLASKLQWERTSKANGWTTDHNMFTFAAFLSWHTAKRAGRIDLEWKAFLEHVVDASVDPDPPAAASTDDAADSGEGPTNPAPGTD